MTRRRMLCVIGTRPEAIKMAPVVHAMDESGEIDVRICLTAQHRRMLDQVMELFGLQADYDLDIMRPRQALSDLAAAILQGLRRVLKEARPDTVLVHGDTTTTLTAALAAFHERIPVAHVEAGLRSGDLKAPFPEEANRRLTDHLSRWLFAPTEKARDNLMEEGHDADRIFVTGNTVIDALLSTVQRAREEAVAQRCFDFLDAGRRLLLVTAHRRENHGRGMESLCRALSRLARRDDLEIVYPVHLNPAVQDPVRRHLSGRTNIHLLDPLDYLPFVALMDRASILLTDSGGIQEEAPSLGKPVLVMRETSERPEAIASGTTRLVGTDEQAIVREVERLLDDPIAYTAMAIVRNPYGDGHAALRIVDALLRSG